MADNKVLEATDVRRSDSKDNKVTILVLAKDLDGNTYTIPFVLKSHYIEGVQKSFSRLSPIKLSAAGPEVKEEAKDE